MPRAPIPPQDPLIGARPASTPIAMAPTTNPNTRKLIKNTVMPTVYQELPGLAVAARKPENDGV